MCAERLALLLQAKETQSLLKGYVDPSASPGAVGRCNFCRCCQIAGAQSTSGGLPRLIDAALPGLAVACLQRGTPFSSTAALPPWEALFAPKVSGLGHGFAVGPIAQSCPVPLADLWIP